MYTEELTAKLLKLITDYNKVIGCEVNRQKSISFLHTRNKQRDFEIKSSINSSISK
jgi:hypothetical protein